MKALKHIPWFYFGFSVYPLLALWATNASNTQPSAIFRPFLLTLVGVSLLYVLLYFITRRNAVRAAILGTIITLLFFSYGHVYDTLRHSDIAILRALGRHRVLTPAYGSIAVAGIATLSLVRKSIRPKTEQPFLYLNSIAAILIVVPATQLGHFYLSSAYQHYRLSQEQFTEEVQPAAWTQQLPDIYVFVLDGYARADALQQDLGYDNSPFINKLEEMGFYVAKCSRPNYVDTARSVATLLNMEYIPALVKKSSLWSFAQYSDVRRQLAALGYKTVAFRTSYAKTEILNAAIFLGLDQPTLTTQMLFSPFEALYAKTTLIRLWTDVLYKVYLSSVSPRPSGERENFDLATLPPDFVYHATLQTFVLHRLLEVPSVEGPKFVFAHILVTHPPYVFAPDGTILTDPGYYSGKMADAINDEYRRQGYIYAMEYLNDRLIPILDNILKHSHPRPIIILQGDHGFRGENRLTILNAYYFPDRNVYEHLYASITPVNSFRIIFNNYFGGDYSLLPDVSYDNDNNVVPETYPSCLP